MNLEGIMLSELHQRDKEKWYNLYADFKKAKLWEPEKRVVVTRGWWGGENEEMLVKQYELPFIRLTHSGDLMYVMVVVVNSIVLYTWLELKGFLGGSDDKESACNAGNLSSIPGSGRSPREGHGYPFQYSCLENSMDRAAWRAVVHGVTNSQTWLSNWHFHFFRSEVTDSKV